MASSLLSVAEAQLLQGKFDEAEPLVKRALAINVSNNPPHKAAMNLNNLAVTYLNCGNAARAEQLLNEAIRLDPAYDLPYCNRSLARAKLGNVEGANEDSKEWRSLGN